MSMVGIHISDWSMQADEFTFSSLWWDDNEYDYDYDDDEDDDNGQQRGQLNLRSEPQQKPGILHIPKLWFLLKVKNEQGTWKTCTGFGWSQTWDLLHKRPEPYPLIIRSLKFIH